jgi:branched-chain amino acid transport system permease protein/neutral amino acid transport system permease protein
MDILVPSIGFGLVTASIVALAAVGFTLQFAITNIINLAYGDVMTAAAFVAFVCNQAGFNIWICLVIGAIFGAVASVALNRAVYGPFIRHGASSLTIVIVTLAVALIVQNVVLAIWGPNFYSYTMASGASVHLGGLTFTLSQLGIIAISVAAMAAVHVLLTYTKLGKAMRATASDPALARNCGIHTERIIDLTWLISGALCGAAGVVLVINTASFTATTGGNYLLVIAAAAILGGIGRPYGAMLGALVIGLSTEVSAAFISPSYKDVVAFVLLVAVLLVRPQGLFSGTSSARGVTA